MESETTYQTRGGVKIYAYPQPAAHRFCLSLYVRGGILYEPEGETGITHFLEHMFFRRLGGLDQAALYDRLQRMGADFNACTYHELICFDMKAAPQHFDACAELLAGVLAPLEATPADVAAERRRIQSEIREKDEFNSLEYLAQCAVWEGTPLARPSIGTVKGVQKIHLRTLQQAQQTFFKRDSLFFYATGCFTQQNIASLCRAVDAHPLSEGGAALDNAVPEPAAFGRRGPAVRIRDCADDLSEVLLSFDLCTCRYAPAELNLLYDLLFAGETGRFKLALSEKSGLVYDFDAYVERYRNIGRMYVSYSVVRGRLLDSLHLVAQTLRSVGESVTDDDLALFLPQYTDNGVFLLDDPAELNWEMAYINKFLGGGAKNVEEEADAYRAVRPERLMTMAREIFRPENLLCYLRADRHKIRADDVRKALAGL